jgi:isoleucyl-tRNA synthetase
MSKRLGNAADPFDCQRYGPDATRWYMISNANPWDNLKFDLEGIAEVRRKFFGTFTTPILSLVCMLILMVQI